MVLNNGALVLVAIAMVGGLSRKMSPGLYKDRRIHSDEREK